MIPTKCKALGTVGDHMVPKMWPAPSKHPKSRGRYRCGVTKATGLSPLLEAQVQWREEDGRDRIINRWATDTKSKWSSHKIYPQATSCSTQKHVRPPMPIGRQRWRRPVFSSPPGSRLAWEVRVGSAGPSLLPASQPLLFFLSASLPLLPPFLYPSLSYSFAFFFPPSLLPSPFTFIPSSSFFFPSCSLLPWCPPTHSLSLSLSNTPNKKTSSVCIFGGIGGSHRTSTYTVLSIQLSPQSYIRVRGISRN